MSTTPAVDPTQNYASDDVAQSFRPGAPSGTADLENQVDATNQLAANQGPAQPSQPSYPSSPDQGGPVPDSGNDAQQPQQPFWRRVVVGALSGMLDHAKGAAEGLYSGGIPGAIRGAVDPNAAEQQYRNEGVVNQAHADEAVAQSQLTKYQAQNANEQMAINQLHQLELQREYNLLPKTQQQEFDLQHETS